MSDDNVVILDVKTRLRLPHERVLNAAIEEIDGEREVVVLGYDKDGSLWFSSNDPNAGGVLILLERAKIALLQELGAL